MSQLLIVNPSVRPSKRKGVRKMAKRRTAKQVAATRKLVAMNRARKSGSVVKTRRRRKARASNPAPLKYRSVRRKVMSVRRRRSARRRNPIGGFSLGALTSLMKDGAIGATGALAVDLAMGYIPLPAIMVSRKTESGGVNYVYYLTKAVAAVGVGALGKKVIGRSAETAAMGAMVVNFYDLFRSLMPAGVSLGYVSPGRRAMGAYTARSAATATPQQITNAQVRNLNTTGSRMGAYVSR